MDRLEVYVTISQEEFSLICRICLSKGELKPFGDKLSSLFFALTGIQARPDDNLPSNICLECICKLQDISQFIDLSKLNDAGLRKVVKVEHQTFSEQCEESMDNDAFNESAEFTVKVEAQSADFKEHREETESSENYDRKVCFEQKVTDTKNKRTISESNKFDCFHCDKTFSSKNKLKVHLVSHSDEQLFQCKLCGKKFKFSHNLVRHTNSEHKNLKPFKCEICHKEFSRRERKVRHLKTHAVKSDSQICYCCKDCQETFNRKLEYRKHMEEHHPENSETRDLSGVKCQVCGNIFVSKYVLQTHMLTHNGKKEFLCNICGKEFLKKVYLDVHTKIHTDEKPFECKVCGKRFRQSSTYNTHLVIHTGERLYKCDQCDKTFKQNNHLKRHVMVHEGVKPHGCTYCGKHFAQFSNLKSHTRLHTGETPYRCSICGKGFPNSSNLKKHKKSHAKSEVGQLEAHKFID